MDQLQLQWNLDRTVDRGLKVALDFVHIAHDDNVQPIALMACERFGATLPICRDTRLLVENECKSHAEDTLLSSIKAMIIPAGGQALQRLASNVAGLNFVSLAVALVSTTSVEESARAIQQMIEDSASEKYLVPPEHHIRAILEVLERRLNRVGFLDRCCATERWLKDTLSFYEGGYEMPNGTGSMVSALRNLVRLGDENIDQVVFTAHTCLAWVITFVEWCLGTSPVIRLSNGSVVNHAPESRVVVVIPQVLKPSEGVFIETFTRSHDLFDKVRIHQATDERGEPMTLAGMVTVHTLSAEVLQSARASSGIGLRAIIETVSYAIVEALDSLTPQTDPFSQSATPERFAYQARLFPSRVQIENTVRDYLGPYSEHFRGLRKLSAGAFVLDLPILRQWAKETYGSGCEPCNAKQQDLLFETPGADITLEDHLKLHIVRDHVARMTGHILALSLIDSDLSAVRFRFLRNWRPEFSFVDFHSQIYTVLSRQHMNACNAEDIINYILLMIGHMDAGWENSRTWLATSYRGQVLLPRLLSTMSLENEPCIQFLCLPGVLTMQGRPRGETFSSLTSPQVYGQSEKEYTKEPIGVPSSQINTLSRFSHLRHSWVTRALPDSIQVHLDISKQAGSYGRVDPADMFKACPLLLFIPHCEHPELPAERSPLEDHVFVHPDDLLNYPSPEWRIDKILVYAVRGNNPLRLMILGNLRASRSLVGFSGSACLQCSLEWCRRRNARYLIC